MTASRQQLSNTHKKLHIEHVCSLTVDEHAVHATAVKNICSQQHADHELVAAIQDGNEHTMFNGSPISGLIKFSSKQKPSSQASSRATYTGSIINHPKQPSTNIMFAWQLKCYSTTSISSLSVGRIV
jgi:hypothetical protein